MKTSNIDIIVKIMLSAIFVLSGIGKLIDIPASSFSIAQLFFLPKLVAQIFVVILSVIELGLAVLIWRWAPRTFLVVPVAFALVLGYSYWKGFDCGCFGSLPFLKEFPLVGHVLLISGIFLGLNYLTRTQNKKDSNLTAKMGLAAIAITILAFLTLPFTSGHSEAIADEPGDMIVDRTYVERAIAENSAVIIDARDEMQFLFGHIDGAINIYVDDDGVAELVEKHNLKEQALITYCAGVHCDMAERLTKKLQELGCRNVKIYAGGWEEWALESY